MYRTTKLSVLHITADENEFYRLRQWMKDEAPAYEWRNAADLRAARRILEELPPDAVLLDLDTPDSAGLEEVRALRFEFPNMAVVVLAGRHENETVVETLRAGAQDYLFESTMTPSVVARTLLYAAERRHAEAQLQLKAKQFEAVFQAVPVGIVILDLEGRIVTANIAFCERLKDPEVGSGAQGLGGRLFIDFIAEHSRSQVEVMLRGVELEREKALDQDIQFRNLEEWGSLRSVMVFPEGLSAQIVVTIEFVGERRRLESNLLRSRKLEAIGRLAGGIAHDFNNLLTAQLGHTQMLRQALADERHLLSELEGLELCADRAARLTRKLLTFSQRQTLQPESLLLNDVLESLVRNLRIPFGKLTIQLELPPEPLVTIGDIAQLDQALWDICENSQESMPGGGTLVLALRRLTEDGAEWAEITVTDDGEGMSSQVLEDCIEPFFTTKQDRTGLGLSTAFGSVESMNGKIRLQSRPGDGTKVFILLPLSDQRPNKPEGDGSGAHTRGRILLVEDDKAVRDLLTRYFEKRGFIVMVAENAARAREYLQTHKRFDVVISDVVMPGESGDSLADWLTSEYPGTPVVLISGYSPDPELRARVKDRELHFLAKPFTPAELHALVNRVTPSRADS